ncbi:unnamed protein product [Ceutorhynchus assimilis]|uniref:Spaetzle domain-containing protein n=1 Tax=Ceutorhynchus assimilis TaxID=467358 RepID=A0A9N9MIA5_9CUCU|nr:unnamed protein product [Ceutorhynchus assimilis]
MLIAHWIQALVALLGLAAVFQRVKSEEHYNKTLTHGMGIRGGNRHRHHAEYLDLFENRGHYPNPTIPLELMFGEPKRNQSEIHRQLRKEFAQVKDYAFGVNCCPTVIEMTEPDGGKNDQGMFVELYRSDNYKQRFYELSCHASILNQPCRFMEKHLQSYSRCVQTYSYTYALVKDTPSVRTKNRPTFPGAAGNGNSSYTLDYISVRSGCACVVMPREKRRHKKDKIRLKSYRRSRP